VALAVVASKGCELKEKYEIVRLPGGCVTVWFTVNLVPPTVPFAVRNPGIVVETVCAWATFRIDETRISAGMVRSFNFIEHVFDIVDRSVSRKKSISLI
jgi:hypothetical protein